MTYQDIRKTRRYQIENFFHDNLGKEFSSVELHMRFGSAFRSRVSEINRDPERTVTIKNKWQLRSDHEKSVYYAVSLEAMNAERQGRP